MGTFMSDVAANCLNVLYTFAFFNSNVKYVIQET